MLPWKTLKMSLLLPVLPGSACAPVIIYFHGSREETTRLEHIDRNVIWSVRRQKYLHRLLRSAGQTTTTYTAGHCHPNCFMPDGLLPYSSAGNAVLPHGIPHGSDITGRIRHARKKCAWHPKRKFQKSFENTKLQQLPPKRARRSTVCAHSLLNHKLHPTSFTFHRKATKKFILLLLKLLCAFFTKFSLPQFMLGC